MQYAHPDFEGVKLYTCLRYIRAIRWAKPIFCTGFRYQFISRSRNMKRVESTPDSGIWHIR